MSDVSLNDIVYNWGLPRGYGNYDEAKRALIGSRTQHEVSVYGGADSFNEGLYRLADVPAVLAEDAVLWLDAQFSQPGEQFAVNQGTGGSVLDATYGSTATADTNDPVFLPHTHGENYIYFPGAANNNCTTPFVAFNQTGDVEIVIETRGINWSDAARTCLAGSWPTSGFLVDKFNSTNLLIGNSNSATNCYATPAHGLVGVVDQWFKFVYRKSTGDWLSYKSADGSNWTLLTGATSVPAPGVDFPNGTSYVAVGGHPSTGWTAGRIPFFEMRSGVNGPAFLRYRESDNTSANHTGWTGSLGEVWTINRAADGRKAVLVTRPVWLFGTDDYLEVADNSLLDFALADSFTLIAVYRTWHTQPNDSSLIGKSTGYQLMFDTSVIKGYIFDGTNLPSRTVTTPYGPLHTATFVRNTSLDVLQLWLDGVAGATTPDTTTATLENGAVLRIGTWNGVYASMELVAVAVFRRVLTTDEIAEINTYYGTA